MFRYVKTNPVSFKTLPQQNEQQLYSAIRFVHYAPVYILNHRQLLRHTRQSDDISPRDIVFL